MLQRLSKTSPSNWHFRREYAYVQNLSSNTFVFVSCHKTMPLCKSSCYVLLMCTVITYMYCTSSATTLKLFKASDVPVGNLLKALVSNQLQCFAECEKRGQTCWGVLYSRADRHCGLYGYVDSSTTAPTLSQGDGIFYRVRCMTFQLRYGQNLK